MALVKINGRTQFFNVSDMEITKLSNGHFEVSYDGGERSFRVMGGRESGGAANEWFCHHPEFYGNTWMNAKSMVEAIRLGAVY